MNTKKLIAIASAFAMISCLTGCNSKSKTDSNITDETVETTTVPVETTIPIKTPEEAMQSSDIIYEYRVIDDVLKFNIPTAMTTSQYAQGHNCMIGRLGDFGSVTLDYTYKKNFSGKALSFDEVFTQMSDMQYADLHNLMMSEATFTRHSESTEDFKIENNKFKIEQGYIEVKYDDTYMMETYGAFKLYYVTCYGLINNVEHYVNNLPVMLSLYSDEENADLRALFDEINKTVELNFTENTDYYFKLDEDGNIVEETTTNSTETTTIKSKDEAS